MEGVSPAPLPRANLPGFKGLPEVAEKDTKTSPAAGLDAGKVMCPPGETQQGRLRPPGRLPAAGGHVAKGETLSGGAGSAGPLAGMPKGKPSANARLSKESSNASLPGAISPFRSKEYESSSQEGMKAWTLSASHRTPMSFLSGCCCSSFELGWLVPTSRFPSAAGSGSGWTLLRAGDGERS